MQKTFLSAEATTYLYASLYDPNLPKGIYNNNRDRIVGWGRDALVSYLGVKHEKNQNTYIWGNASHITDMYPK